MTTRQKQLIENYITKTVQKILKEENELLKAQSQCKAAIFQIKKQLDPLLKTWNQTGYFNSISSKVLAYNDGYELRINSEPNYEKLRDSEDGKMIFSVSRQNIFIQPGTFFDDYLEKGETANIEGRVFSTEKDYQGVRYPIKAKQDIPTACKQFLSVNLKVLSGLK